MENSDFKFRAWDTERKQMVTRFLIAPTSPTWGAFVIRDDKEVNSLVNSHYRKKGDILGGDYSMLDWADYYGLDKLKIMRFTGFKDFNGKEIFEGDILKFKCDEIGDSFGEVRFSKAGFWTSQPDNEHEEILSEELDDFETVIIGNIYETPELKCVGH